MSAGSAINDLVARLPGSRRKDVILLDDKSYSFGINLLHCDNPADPLELDRTVGRVLDIFVKVWGDERGQLGVWLELSAIPFIFFLKTPAIH